MKTHQHGIKTRNLKDQNALFVFNKPEIYNLREQTGLKTLNITVMSSTHDSFVGCLQASEKQNHI
jgi:hypothetical protein